MISSNDIAHWVKRSTDITLMLEGEQLSDEDKERLRHIEEWCQASPLLWNIISRIGWEINEG